MDEIWKQLHKDIDSYLDTDECDFEEISNLINGAFSVDKGDSKGETCLMKLARRLYGEGFLTDNEDTTTVQLIILLADSGKANIDKVLKNGDSAISLLDDVCYCYGKCECAKGYVIRARTKFINNL